MNDVVPPFGERWRALERHIVTLLGSYGYREIRMPLLESTQVFARSIGDATDIVQKEMYTFTDRNGDSLTLRPEGTASCVRACLENSLLQTTGQRLFYLGPMFRHERPQKGRYRQFHQVGVEVFGLAGPEIDAELILMTARLWNLLGLHDLRLEINTLGTPAEREAYRARLVDYFTPRRDALDEESQTRLGRNPLRILDSKNPALAPLIASAPRLTDSLGPESTAHFAQICAVLEAANIKYTVNPHLVRGLDYYSQTVFEWITTELGAQGTVCAGGRYDGLVELMGGRPTPAIGFALGLERLLELITDQVPALQADADFYVIAAEAAQRASALVLAEELRDAFPSLRTLCHCGPESIKTQMKRADRSGARVALILGPDEMMEGTVTIKSLREAIPQSRVARSAMATALSAFVT